ncbi:MAG: M15 family metallopeptidase [Burkholderiales bacterium]
MSARIFADDILFFQRLLRSDGLYLDDLDGIWGPITEAAVVEFERRADAIAADVGAFDARTENNIRTLAVRAQRPAREFLRRVRAAGIGARVISGTRTYAMQDALYRQGRFGNPGPRVTNARGGQSNHNFGIAWDIGIFTAGGGYVTEGPPYDDAATAGAAPELEWGGDWASFVDKPHWQLATGMSLAELRARFESGDWP